MLSLRARATLRPSLLPLLTQLRTMATLETLRFDNRQLRELPVDTGPNEVRTVRGAAFARVAPTPVANPRLVALSPPALALVGLRADEVAAHPAAAEYLAGNKLLPGSEPAAHCYCGHQFGSFAGQLGDGATMYLGEVLHPATGERWELQFKGAGKTPFSRTADGRKVLRSSLREFLCSEAMAALGVPTTRAGSVVTSDSTVTRDVFYTGDAIQERCTVITRLAPSFLRFGSPEVVKTRDPMTGREGPSPGDGALLDRLLGYVCTHFYGHLAAAHPGRPGEAYEAMYAEIVRRSAALVAQWQAQGFAHGVLNTDNMSLLGLTIDYGPFGWMDRYDPGFICNASDNGGRYSFENQPAAVRWNCAKLGEVFAMSPALRAHVAQVNAALGGGGSGADGADDEAWDFRSVCSAAFGSEFERVYHGLMRRKLGLGFAAEAAAAAPDAAATDSSGGDGFDGGLDDDAGALLGGLLETMHATGADYTNTLRALAAVDPLGADLTGGDGSGSSGSGDPVLAYLLTQTASAAEMAAATKPQVPLEQLQKLARVAAVRPELMIDVAEVQREIRRHAEWAAASKRTDADKAADDAAAWAAWLARYRARLVAELPAHLRQYAPTAAGGGGAAGTAGMPAEAHAEVRRLVAARQGMMRRSNPRLVLRNWVAHRAIAAAEAGDYSEVARVLEAVQDPFGLRDDGGAGEADVSYWFAGSGAGDAAAAAAATAADLATSHVDAPNTADEGATRLPARGMTQPPATCAAGGSSGLLLYASRPPPALLSLKVT